MGYEDVSTFSSPRLARAINGIRRQRGEIDLRERKPVTRDILLELLPLFDQTTRYGATMHAAFCLAFAGFLRPGEFTWREKDLENELFAKWHLTTSSVIFYDDFLLLTLPVSKTDPFRRGVTISIAAANDEACPVKSLKHLLTAFPARQSAPLFFPGQALSPQLVIQELRKKMMQLGHQGNYSGHSFRRGAATSAERAGLSRPQIKILGRWKSEAVERYIDKNPAVYLATLRIFQQLPIPPSSPR